MRIEDIHLRPQANNLTLCRLLLASSVIYSHCFVTTVMRGQEGDNLSWLLGAPISAYGVDGFFFLSGFLVYRSLATSQSVSRFIRARLTRLWPGLAVMIALTIIAGSVVTSADLFRYFTGAETVRYAGFNLLFLRGFYTLTGVMCGGEPCVINGSLWTLPWEARSYLILTVLGLLGLANRRWMLRIVLPTTAIFAAVWAFPGVAAAIEARSHGLAFNVALLDRLWFAFALGILAYELRDRIVLSWTALAVVVVANLAAQHILPEAVSLHLRSLTIGYGMLCLGFLAARNRGAVSGHWPDYSYGMYIYAFQTMVAAHALLPAIGPYSLMLINILSTLPLAAASWHLVEKPALDRLRHRQKTAFRSRPPEEHPRPAQ